MFLQALTLRNFRCHRELTLMFSPGFNQITGNNAVGKTSVLEAIHLLMTGRSFRSSTLADMLFKQDQEESQKESSLQQNPVLGIEGFFVKHGVEQRVALYFDGALRQIFYNSTSCASLSHLLGLIQGVTVHPDDVMLIKGAPMQRRQFLDLQLAQTDPLYVHHLHRYYRGMRQRNTLLKAKQTATLESWEHEMAHAAAYLVGKRFCASSALQSRVARLYREIGGEHASLTLSYKSSFSLETLSLEEITIRFQELYKKQRKRELELGVTLHGPHKDDLLIAIGGREVKAFASEGQQRTTALVLKLAEWELMRDVSDVVPLIQMDDIGVSLDNNRLSALLRYLENLKQVFVTSTKAVSCKEVGKHFIF